jgi:hypothetical protein
LDCQKCAYQQRRKHDRVDFGGNNMFGMFCHAILRSGQVPVDQIEQRK